MLIVNIVNIKPRRNGIEILVKIRYIRNVCILIATYKYRVDIILDVNLGKEVGEEG